AEEREVLGGDRAGPEQEIHTDLHGEAPLVVKSRGGILLMENRADKGLLLPTLHRDGDLGKLRDFRGDTKEKRALNLPVRRCYGQ
ncbi:MAG TPA: hypothetical protein VLM40_12955, partial [Gemmata sp.]|nr:hypothetical protein [Gemmata sp.]